MAFYGNATMFSSCKSANDSCTCNNNTCKCGACGTCRWDDGGVAYPAVNGFPGDYQRPYSVSNPNGRCNSSVPYCCNTSTGPGYLPYESCGTYLSLTNYCKGGGVLTPIVDHGPGAACTRDHLECEPLVIGYRLLDLTPVTYSDVGGNATYGRVMLEITP